MAVFPEEVERWRALVAKYFPPSEVDRALWTVWHESGGNPGIASRFNAGGGEDSHGLWQINLKAHPQMAGLAVNPEAATAYAAQLWRSQGWQPWSVTHNGFPDDLGGSAQARAVGSGGSGAWSSRTLSPNPATMGPAGRTFAQVTGNEYLSDAERAWYLSQVKGGSMTQEVDEFGFPVMGGAAPAAPTAAAAAPAAAAPAGAPEGAIPLPGGGYMIYVPAVGDYAVFMPKASPYVGEPATVEFSGWRSAAPGAAGAAPPTPRSLTYDAQGNAYLLDTRTGETTPIPTLNKGAGGGQAQGAVTEAQLHQAGASFGVGYATLGGQRYTRNPDGSYSISGSVQAQPKTRLQAAAEASAAARGALGGTPASPSPALTGTPGAAAQGDIGYGMEPNGQPYIPPRVAGPEVTYNYDLMGNKTAAGVNLQDLGAGSQSISLANARTMLMQGYIRPTGNPEQDLMAAMALEQRKAQWLAEGVPPAEIDRRLQAEAGATSPQDKAKLQTLMGAFGPWGEPKMVFDKPAVNSSSIAELMALFGQVPEEDVMGYAAGGEVEVDPLASQPAGFEPGAYNPVLGLRKVLNPYYDAADLTPPPYAASQYVYPNTLRSPGGNAANMIMRMRWQEEQRRRHPRAYEPKPPKSPYWDQIQGRWITQETAAPAAAPAAAPTAIPPELWAWLQANKPPGMAQGGQVQTVAEPIVGMGAYSGRPQFTLGEPNALTGGAPTRETLTVTPNEASAPMPSRPASEMMFGSGAGMGAPPVEPQPEFNPLADPKVLRALAASINRRMRPVMLAGGGV